MYTVLNTFFMGNPNLQSELTNSFTQGRKLRNFNLRESRFLIVRFLIIRLHRSTSTSTSISTSTQRPVKKTLHLHPPGLRNQTACITRRPL